MSNHKTTHHGDAQDKYNIALGLLEPELKKLAEEIRKVAPKVTSEKVRRLIGLFNAFLESKTNNLPPLAGAFLKQVTKVLDDVFLDESGHKGDHPEEHEVKKMVDDWETKLFSDAVERIKNSDTPEEDAMKIKKQVAAIMSVLQEIKRLKAEHTPTRVEPENENSIFETLNHVWSGIVGFFQGLKGPFLVYTVIVLLTILIAVICAVVVMAGVASGSNLWIFIGGIALLIEVVVVAVVLLPAALGVNIFRAIMVRLSQR